MFFPISGQELLSFPALSRFSLRSISVRVRWRLGAWLVPSRRGRCCHQSVSRRPAPGPWTPGPPRCCADLRRLTTRRSRSPGFAAPPPSLGLSTWTLASSVGPPAGPFPVQPGYRPWPCTHPRGPRPRSGPALPVGRRLPSVRSVPPPVGLPAPATLPARGIHFPARRVPPEPPGGSPRWLAPVVPTGLAPARSRRASSRAPTPASVRLRRFSRPWRLAPPRTRWSLSSTRVPGVRPLLPAAASGRTARRPHFPARVPPVGPRFGPMGRGGRDLAQKAPGRLGGKQRPKAPSARSATAPVVLASLPRELRPPVRSGPGSPTRLRAFSVSGPPRWSFARTAGPVFDSRRSLRSGRPGGEPP
jgi:hypothetical protein